MKLYYLLEKGDVIIRGDEWWDQDDCTWNKCYLFQNSTEDGSEVVRREYNPPNESKEE